MPPTTQPKPAAGAPPTDEELRRALEEERRKSQTLEAQNRELVGAARSEWDRAERAQQELRRRAAATPAEKDPFIRLSEEGPALDADKQQELLDRGVRGRVRQEIGRFAEEDRKRRDAEEYQKETGRALGRFGRQHPEIATDQENFAGALTIAQIRAQKQGLELDPYEMLEMGLSVYNERKATPGDQVPYTEGASMPGGPSVTTSRPAAPKGPSIWEKLYGAKDVVDEENENWSLDTMTEQYLDRKNLELVKEGFTSQIGQIMGQLEEAKARQAATAGR